MQLGMTPFEDERATGENIALLEKALFGMSTHILLNFLDRDHGHFSCVTRNNHF
jgi:hypothetical protein